MKEVEKSRCLCLWGVNMFTDLYVCLIENSTLNDCFGMLFPLVRDMSTIYLKGCYIYLRRIGSSFLCLLWSIVSLRGKWGGNFWITICTSSYFSIYGLWGHTPGPSIAYSTEYILTAVIILCGLISFWQTPSLTCK